MNKTLSHLFLYAICILLVISLSACHSYNYEVIEKAEATCLTAGHITYQCKECGDSYTRDRAVGTLEATCTAPRTCKTCGETRGNAYGHNLDSNGKCVYCSKQIVRLSNQLPATFLILTVAVRIQEWRLQLSPLVGLPQI